MGSTTSTEAEEEDQNKVTNTPTNTGSGSSPKTPTDEQQAPVKQQVQVTDELWDMIQSQLSTLSSKQQFWEKQVEHEIEQAFPTIKESSEQKLQDRCKSLFNLTKDKFFKESHRLDLVSTIEASTFPSEEFLGKLDPSQQELVDIICSPKILDKFVKKTLHKALESDNPLKFLAEQIKWDEIHHSFLDSFSFVHDSVSHLDTAAVHPTVTTSTGMIGSDTSSMGVGTSHPLISDYTYYGSVVDPTNQMYCSESHIDPHQTLDAVGSHLDTLSSHMSNLDYFNEYMDQAVPIPVITIGVDVFKEIKLLSKGKTEVGTATGHIVGHALAVTIGSGIGGALGTLIAPGIGTILGSVIGCKIGNVLYNDFKNSELKDCLKRFNEYSHETKEQLIAMISNTESEMKKLVDERLKVIKANIESRRPLELNRVLLADAQILELFPMELRRQDSDLDSLLKSREFRDQMSAQQDKAQKLLTCFLKMMDQHQVIWNLWAQSAQVEVWESQKVLGESFKNKLQEIDDKIKTFNERTASMKKEAQEEADKLGIELSFT